jgi:hypothetical protein
MKRVLIITYYWPPSGGSGVQRWLKMSKYLPEYGWQPVIYTPEDGEFPIEDPSLEKDVSPEAEIIKRPIIEPYTLYKKFIGIKKEEKVKAGFIKEKGQKTNWKENLATWVRGNLFIPDARCWWIKPSVRYLKKYLKDHPVDAIISTGPPHSMHLIAMKLKEAMSIPWIADFRDPWTEIEYYDDLHLTSRSDRKHHRLEHEVLSKADTIVTVTPNWARNLGRLGNRNVRVIYNGFDQDDNYSSNVVSQITEGTFSITYIGVLMKVRNPEKLWQALGELVKGDPSIGKDLKVNLIGQIDNSVRNSIVENGLTNKVNYQTYVPHDQVAAINKNSSVLLLTLNPDNKPLAKGLVPAKLFEYLASGRPILCIGPNDGDAARILKETKAGITIGFDDKEKMKEVIMDYYQQYITNGLPDNETTSIEKYSRKALAGEYASLLDKIKK